MKNKILIGILSALLLAGCLGDEEEERMEESQETPLLPLIDYDDKKDIELMEIIGNIYENSELIKDLED